MPHDTPWLVESGVHSAGVARQLAHVASKGQEGISDLFDCRVVASDVPDTYVNVLPGSYSVLLREPGYPKEMYAGRVRPPDKVAVEPTTSSGGRTDLIVVRIENPATSAYNSAAPFAFTRVIKNVDPQIRSVLELNRGTSEITLAKVTLPASTGAVTNNMIIDLRSITPNPFPALGQFTDDVNYTSPSTLPPPPNGSGTRTSVIRQWPAGASWQVPVPTWATEASCYYSVNPYLTDNTWGNLAFNWNGRYIAAINFDVNYPLISGVTRCGFTNAGGMRALYVAGGKIAIPASERGSTIPVRIDAATIDSSAYAARGSSVADRGSVGHCSIAFKQGAVAA